MSDHLKPQRMSAVDKARLVELVKVAAAADTKAYGDMPDKVRAHLMLEDWPSVPSDGWQTERDEFYAMGIMLGIVDGMRSMGPKSGTDALVVWAGATHMVEEAAKGEFGEERWEKFAAQVRARVRENARRRGN